MTEVINVLENQVNKLNLVIEGLKDRSRLAYPAEYDLGRSLLKEVVSDVAKVRDRLSERAYQSWLSSRL